MGQHTPLRGSEEFYDDWRTCMTMLHDPPAPSAPSADDSSGGLAFIGMAGLLIALVATVVVIGVIGLLRDESTGGGGGAAAAGPTTLGLTLSEFSIDGQLSAQPGDVSLLVTNNGSQQHNLVVRETGAETPMLNTGDNATLALGMLDAGSYELFCSVAGHAESGMMAPLEISESSAASSGEAAGGDIHDHTSPDFDADAMDQIMIDSMNAFPAETEGKGNQILEPEILADGTKKFTLEASIIDWEVSPGQIVEAWAYNGQVPGPQIIVDVGDNVQVELTNNTPMGTDIHWHGIQTPNDMDGVTPFTQDPIRTGETFTYEFVAQKQSIGMYHAHLHSQISVVNGMFAAFRIGERPYPRGMTVSGVTIPEDFEPDVELPMVLNDAGTIGLTLNGKSFPATEPLVLQEGDWVAADYYNEGLTAHPMHQHQFPQLVYAKDGIPLDYPYWADTINVAAGERYSVLFQAVDPGVWVWHCHILTHVERDTGMFGMVTAVVVEEAATNDDAPAEEPVTEDASAEG
jgi:FtsP/CotA-like multicopper oxidase with cupredoxin domain